MAALPWLVVHGTEVWAGALAGLTAIGAAIGLGFRRLRHARRSKRAARALGPASTSLQLDDGVRVTLAGRLRVPAPTAVLAGVPAAALTAHRVGPAGLTPMISAAERELFLEVDGQLVALVGERRVLAGSAEVRVPRFGLVPWMTCEALSASAPALVAEVAEEDPAVLVASVDAGDRVLAGGLARRVAANEIAGDYRHPAATWQLVMEPGGDGHGIVYAGRARLGRDAWRRALAGAVAGLAIFAIVFVGGGLAAYRKGALELAAATPVRRADALAALADRIEKRLHHDADLLEQEVALCRLRGSAIAEQRALRRHRQLRRAAELGTRGASPALRLGAARALADLGEMAAASRAFEAAQGERGDVGAATVHLLAGRGALAARVLRHVVAAAPAGDPLAGPEGPLLLVADALDARAGGDAAALARLRRAAGAERPSRAAWLLLADLLHGAERAEILRGYGWGGPPDRAAMSLERLLAREIGDTTGRNWERLVYPVWLAFGREERQLWTFFPALFSNDDTLRTEARAPLEAAFVASAIGDHARAVALAPEAGGRPDFYHESGLVALVRLIIERRSRALDPLPDAHGVWLAHPIEAWFRAGSRDGEALASVLDANAADADHAYVVAGSVATRREALSAWLRYGVVEHRSRTRLGRLAELENLHLTAVALGDAGAAAEIGAMVARHRTALLRREVLVPLAILEEITMARGEP